MNNINQRAINLDSQHSSSLSHETSGWLKRLGNMIVGNLKVALPLLLIVVTGIMVAVFVLMQPVAPERRPNLTPPLTVSVIDVRAQNFQVNVQSYGTIAPRTESFLISQVSGQVTEISDDLRVGGFFDKGDVLLRIDNRDYLADLKISGANLADAKQALSQELATSKQAELDWKRLGNTEPANNLVLRIPQQQAARARLASAEAAVSKAQLGLDRTEVLAPFDGRVLAKMVDLGQVAGNNTQIAQVYATDYVEIRLPLRDSDLRFVNLPETYRGVGEAPTPTPVKIFSSLTDSEQPWLGEVVRTESAIDANARQLHVVAQIDDPFGALAVGRTPLKIGEYVTAEIQGKLIQDAIVIPASTIYQNTYVYIVEDGVVIRKNVKVLWQSTEKALIGEGLKNGDRLVTTTLGQVASGTRASIEGEAKPASQRGANGSRETGARNPGAGSPPAERGNSADSNSTSSQQEALGPNGQRPEGVKQRPASAEPDTNKG